MSAESQSSPARTAMFSADPQLSELPTSNFVFESTRGAAYPAAKGFEFSGVQQPDDDCRVRTQIITPSTDVAGPSPIGMWAPTPTGADCFLGAPYGLWGETQGPPRNLVPSQPEPPAPCDLQGGGDIHNELNREESIPPHLQPGSSCSGPPGLSVRGVTTSTHPEQVNINFDTMLNQVCKIFQAAGGSSSSSASTPRRSAATSKWPETTLGPHMGGSYKPWASGVAALRAPGFQGTQHPHIGSRGQGRMRLGRTHNGSDPLLHNEGGCAQSRLPILKRDTKDIQQAQRMQYDDSHLQECIHHLRNSMVLLQEDSLGLSRPLQRDCSREGPGDEIRSAPAPSSPNIRSHGGDSVVERFLGSYPFSSTTREYNHSILKFCADHNLVVKLLGFQGRRVEMLERHHRCRIETSTQSASFPGYPNGRCVLFVGALPSLLRASADLFAVVDTSRPGLRLNVEGYRMCLIVPGEYVGRLLRHNCAGLHGLQEGGGRSVHIALGNLCVIMRGGYSERVLLIDGTLEGVARVLELATTQLQDFFRRHSGIQGTGTAGGVSVYQRYEFLEYPKRIDVQL